MFKKNVAIDGFGIGHFINATTGLAVTTGIPICKRTLDGVGWDCANAASYDSDGAIWKIDLTAGDMNGDMVVLSFTLTDCLPISYTVRTESMLVEDLIPVVAPLPLPSISLATAKILLQITDTEHDTIITTLLPIIEDIATKYCGVSVVTDLSVGATFPIIGLVRYAMENPVGAKSQSVGNDKTEYGEFPNALLTLLDNFKSATGGVGTDDVGIVNLRSINEGLGK